jgi:maltoporin
VLAQQFLASGLGHTGATISIENNQLKYDFSGLSYDSLAQGQVVQDVFFYVLRMGNGAFAVAKVDVSITGENDTPTIDSDGGGDTASVLVPENTSAVTTVHATDPDNGASLTYTIVGGADSSAFTLNPTTGELTFNSAPNFEAATDVGADNAYEVQVQVSDGLGGIDTQTITVDVTDVNEAPNAGTDFSASAAENVGDAVVLADVNATDPDDQGGGGNDATNDFENLKYSITGGNGAGLFEIDADTGQISLASGQQLDYESDNQHVLTVKVQDQNGTGLSDTVDVTINVTDVNEAPNAGTDFSASAAENVGDAVVLADVNATDPDDQGGGGNDATNDFENLKYSITGGNGAGLFEIDADTGQISLASGQQLDYESDNQHVLTVKVQDQNGTGLSDTVDVTINVTDVNEAPNAGTDFSASAAENVGDAVVLADVNATDPDDQGGGGNDATNDFENLKYSITGGNGAGLFEIDADTGQISLASGQQLDYESDNQHVLTVKVQDQNGTGLSDTVDVTINVTDVNEAPNAGTDFSASAAENVGDAVVLADVNATDPDDQGGGGNDATNDFENLKYSITGGNGAGLFEIDADTGQISLASGQQLDYESDNQHVLTVKVQDQNGTGLSDTVDVTINVTDVNEAPNAGTDFSASAAENVGDAVGAGRCERNRPR